MKNGKLTRRNLLKAGTGAAALAATGNLITARRTFAQRAKKIVFWLQPNFNATADQLLVDQTMEFAKVAGIRENEVTILKVPGGEVTKKMAAALEVGAPPDVTRVNESNMSQWINSKQLLPLNDVVAKMRSFKGGINENAMPLATDGDNVYGAPLGLNPQMLHARMDKLEEAGYNSFPETWDKFIEAAVKINKPPFYAYGMALGLTPSDSLADTMSVAWPQGARLIDAAGKPTLDSPGFVKAFEMIDSMYNELKIIPRGTISWNNSGNNQAYQNGQVAFIVNPTSVYSSLVTNNSPLLEKTGLFPAPGGPDGRHKYLYTDYYGAFNKSPYPDLAKGLIDFFVEPKRYNQFIVEAGGRYGPVYPELTKDAFWDLRPQLAGVMDVAREGHTISYPGKMNEALAEIIQTNLVIKGIHRMLIDKQSAADAVAQNQQEAMAIYKRIMM